MNYVDISYYHVRDQILKLANFRPKLTWVGRCQFGKKDKAQDISNELAI